MPQLERGTDCFQKRIHKAMKTLALCIAIMALIQTAPARDMQVDLSKDALLNITQSRYELTDDGANYFVQVKNEGQVLLKNVNVMDALPPGVEYIGLNGTGDLPLLICEENYINRSTKNLTWNLEDIDTERDKWVNFTVRKVVNSAVLSHHEVRATGMAFGYRIDATPLISAEQNSALEEETKPTHVVETTAIAGFSMPLPAAIAENATGENTSIDNDLGG